MSNAEMTELWNGPGTAGWARTPHRYDGMLHDLGVLALEAAGLRAGERVLDVGCGSGQLSVEAAERVGPGGSVTGVDISVPLVAVARERAAAAGADNVRFLVGDAQTEGFPAAAFDVLVSRFGVMFFADPVAAFANLGAATVPGGRLAFVVWQAAPLNEWATTVVGAFAPHLGVPELPPEGAPGPFALADAARVRSLLEAAGWDDVAVDGRQTTVLVGGPGTLDDVLSFYQSDGLGQRLLAQGTPAQRQAAVQALTEAVAPRMSDEGLRLPAAVWVVTARRPD